MRALQPISSRAIELTSATEVSSVPVLKWSTGVTHKR